MSLEAALEANTAAVRDLIAALTGTAAESKPHWPFPSGSPDGSMAAEHANAKKSDTPKTASAASAPSGAPSASTQKKSSDAQIASAKLFDWHEKTAGIYAELKDQPPSLDTVRKAILAINKEIGREQADAVLARFDAQAVTTKADKKGLDESQFPEFFTLCLQVLSGATDATQSME